ncbi:MAG: hypothetical protein QOI34_1462 [Verrucomicrobiota bacterium]|jgi:hypothetical protein
MKKHRWCYPLLLAGITFSCAILADADPLKQNDIDTFLDANLSSAEIAEAIRKQGYEGAKDDDTLKHFRDKGADTTVIGAISQAGKISAANDELSKSAAALCEFLQNNRAQLAKDQTGSRLIWTDTILVEVADSPPPEPLAALLQEASSNDGKLVAWVNDSFEKQLKTWHPAKKNPHPTRQGTDEIVTEKNGSHCFVNPIYLSYILARYPKANIQMKTPTDPVLFTISGKVCAVLAPWTKLPDGTPLL